MNKVWIALLGTVTLANCGQVPQGKTLQITGFEENVAEFETASQQYAAKPQKIDDLIIVYGDPATACPDDGNHGTACCIHNQGQTPVIVVREQSESLEAMMDPYFTRVVMLHELGHCILGRTNSDDTMSIMYSNPAAISLDNFYSAYMNEYFNPKEISK